MTLAVDVLANAIRSNPHTTSMGAATLAERYLRALHAAGYVVQVRGDGQPKRHTISGSDAADDDDL